MRYSPFQSEFCCGVTEKLFESFISRSKIVESLHPFYTDSAGDRAEITVPNYYNGAFALQDTDVKGIWLGGRPQQVYTVRFAAQELWGSHSSPRDTVHVDLWEDYLERA